jgi:hypothetical protein
MNNKFKKRKDQLMIQNIVKRLSGFSLINIEEEHSIWVHNFNGILSQFLKIESIPVESIPLNRSSDEYLSWVRCGFDFLEDKK